MFTFKLIHLRVLLLHNKGVLCECECVFQSMILYDLFLTSLFMMYVFVEIFWQLSLPFTISQVKFSYLVLITLLQHWRGQFFPFWLALFPPLPCLVGQRLRQSVAFLILK